MRIQALEKATGISKRNIHFYLQKGLITPLTDPGSGYYDFSDDDAKRLIMIKKLREADFPISTIKSIIKTPEATEYYLRLQLEKIRLEREKLQKNHDDILEILKKISVNPNAPEVERLVNENIHERIEAPLPYNSYLVNHFLWRTYYTGEPITEYQEFLLEKIQKMTDKREKNADYAALNDFLVTEDQKRIDELYAERKSQYYTVAQMNEAEILEYAEKMKNNIKKFLSSPQMIFQWKKNMKSYYWPLIRIYTTQIGKIAEDMLPLFKSYKNNSQAACRIVYNWLNTEDGAPTRVIMETRLGSLLNIKDYQHAVLESINSAFFE